MSTLSTPTAPSDLESNLPDILVKSAQDHTLAGIPAHSKRLASGSHVFASMLEIGSLASTQELGSLHTELRTVEIKERHDLLVLLVNLLEAPPENPPPTVNNQGPSSAIPLEGEPPQSVLPWPLLTTLLDLADKYDLSENIVSILHTHLQSHAPSYPLQVYGLATRLELSEISSLASSFLLHPPMHQYSVSDVKAIPSSVAYHLLLVLQTHRLQNLKTIVEREPLFPHDYGVCSKHGVNAPRLVWETRRSSVLDHLHAGSSVAGMMGCDDEIQKELKGCSDCCLGWERAVEMMRYKAGKVPREIAQLPKNLL
ncbi:hypothetical protein BDV93DRAFT_517890 [Ceratobasidium sp. AG-I]|nr:hypothetical protein BDV93DRAFT_517890 [Ceratobasidium sp. AG-I]